MAYVFFSFQICLYSVFTNSLQAFDFSCYSLVIYIPVLTYAVVSVSVNMNHSVCTYRSWLGIVRVLPHKNHHITEDMFTQIKHLNSPVCNSVI